MLDKNNMVVHDELLTFYELTSRLVVHVFAILFLGSWTLCCHDLWMFRFRIGITMFIFTHTLSCFLVVRVFPGFILILVYHSRLFPLTESRKLLFLFTCIWALFSVIMYVCWWIGLVFSIVASISIIYHGFVLLDGFCVTIGIFDK